MATYLEDSKNVPVLNSFDVNMENRSKSLINKVTKDGGLSLEVLDEVLTTMSALGKGTANAVANYKLQMTATNDDIYQFVLKEYLDSSLEILRFCNDMEKFLYEARETHSFIEGKIQDCIRLGMKADVGREEATKISNILKSIMEYSKVNDHSVQNLRERVGFSFEKQKKLLDYVTPLLAETASKKEESTVPFWKKLINYLYSCVMNIVGVFLASIAGMFRRMFRRMDKAANQDELKYSLRKGALDSAKEMGDIQVAINSINCIINDIDSMRKGTLHSVREINEIQVAINCVVNDIDSLLVTSAKVANGGTVGVAINNINHKLEKFSKKIEVLEAKTEKCSSIISEARDSLF